MTSCGVRARRRFDASRPRRRPHGERARRDLVADLSQMEAHAFGVDGRQNERRADAARRQIAPNIYALA